MVPQSLFDATLTFTGAPDDPQLARVPAARGVLCLLGPDGSPIVLLTAADIRSRLRARLLERQPDERRKTADLREVTRAVAWKLAHSHFETDLRFLEIARRLWHDDYGSMLAWRGGWFVHVDPQAALPRFARTHAPLPRSGLCLGPFESGRAADRFVEAIEDGFALCRDVRCLRLAPNAPPCPYAQMGKCAGVADGTTSMDDYRRLVARAARFAGGDRGPFVEELGAAMKRSAAELAFEKASRIKTRLARLAELSDQAYEQVLPMERFRFVCVQRGPTRRSACTFLVCGPQIAPGPALDYPLEPAQLARVLEAMGSMGGRAAAPAQSESELRAGRWRIALVASYLFSGPQRRGVMLRWSPALDAAALAAAVESALEALHLRPPRGTSDEGTGARAGGPAP